MVKRIGLYFTGQNVEPLFCLDIHRVYLSPEAVSPACE